MLNLGKCGRIEMLRLEVNRCFDLFSPGMYDASGTTFTSFTVELVRSRYNFTDVSV